VTTCRLDSCENELHYRGRGRPPLFCSTEHARYHRNHKPEAAAGRKAYQNKHKVNRERARIHERNYRARLREKSSKITKTCALNGCDNTWTPDGTRRKYCSTLHKWRAWNKKK
jgi:hypothetical protein